MSGMFRLFGVFCALVRVTALTIFLIVPGTTMAASFNYASYKPANLDVIAARKPRGLGVDVYPMEKYAFNVTLVSLAKPCPNKFLQWAMLTSGIDRNFIDTVPISKCIQVKSARGRQLSVFIQDPLADSIAKEVPLGGKLTLYTMLVYFATTGPGIVVNEFSSAQTPTIPSKRAARAAASISSAVSSI